MKNKNGFTLIELIVCFAIVTVLTISLFRTVLSIQQKQAKNISYNSFLSFASVLNNTIQNDFNKDIITNVESCGVNCYDITYKNKGLTRLQVDRVNNTITYGSDVEKLPSNYKFVKDISFNTYSSVTTGTYDSYYLLRLPIKSDLFPNMEDIKYMYEYSTSTIETDKYILNLDLNGGTVSGNYNNLLYATGTTVTLTAPKKENMTFIGWSKVSGNVSISGNTFTMGTTNVSLKANYRFSKYDLDYTGSGKTFVVPESGYYKLKLWGADGGNKNTILGGKGGYTEGIFYFEKDQVLYITVGGKGISDCSINSCEGGYNGGGMSSKTYHGSGGGATHIATAPGLLSELSENISSVLIVAGGGGGASNYNSGLCTGGYGGILGGDGFYRSDAPTFNGKGGTQDAGGAATNCPIAGTFGEGGGRSTNSAGGGGGYYGGSCGYGSSGGGGSSYISSIKINDSGIYISGNETIPDHEGLKESENNGYVSIEFVDSVSKNEYNYKNTEIQEKFVVPSTGLYKLEVWGADGGNKKTVLGGKGGYTAGTINLNSGDSLYITIGGKGTSNCSINSCAGGYNGGGMSSNTYHGSGGGATHIATVPGLLSELSENISSVLIVAGGGGGASNYNKTTTNHPGGYGGGTIGGDGDYLSAAPTFNGKGGTQDAGGVKGNCAIAGTFGQGGGRSTSSAGGGGGYYGGSCGYGSSGGGGSGYISSVISSPQYIPGNETIPDHDGITESENNGYVRITYLGE